MRQTGDGRRETGDRGRRIGRDWEAAISRLARDLSALRRLARVAAGFALVALAACERATPPKTAAGAGGVDPNADQVVFGSRTLVTEGGLRRAEVFSDTALFYDDNTRMDMRIVRTIFYSSAGAKDAVLTSRTGRYLTRDNVLEAKGNVVIITADGRRLVTEQIKFDSRVNQISSDSAFVLTEEGREASGVGFVSDPDMNNLRILKGSRAMARGVKVPGTE
ncbi:MAG: LPS export ABC transporter periplasmic protein LptC [Gemmatimonadaceae bacterium]